MKSHAGTTPLLGILVTALVCQAVGCAKATVGNVGQNADAATGDAPQADGKDASSPTDKNGQNDGPASDALYDPCNPFTNAGCSSDQKCAALQSGSSLGLACASKGDKSVGDTCNPVMTGAAQTGDDCGDQLACFKLATDPAYTCHRICPTSGTANACLGTDTCSLVVPGLTNLAFCRATTSCLPLEQTGCPSDQSCYYGTTGAVCAPTGNKHPGDACVNANDCAKGSTCLTVSGAGICMSFCSTASGGTPSCSGSSTGGNICSGLGNGSEEADLGSCRQQS